MAPSQMEHEIGSLEYTHKKFNCGYSHKKLGMRLVRRSSQEELLQEPEMTNQCGTQTSTTLFRPYALEAEERKSHIAEIQQQTSHTAQGTTHQFSNQEDKSAASHYYAQLYSQQQSPDAYALKLQRQRAALYMKHVMQYYENGNGWPTVHPNAFNNGMSYNAHQC